MKYFTGTTKICLIFSVLLSLKASLVKAVESVTDDEATVVSLINQERTNHELPSLKIDPILMNVARYSSQSMAQKDQSSHHCVDGKRTGQRVQESGYCDHVYSTEIILTYPLFSKHRDFTKALKSWMDSPQHRDIILSNGKEDIGVGLAISQKNTTYFTAVFSTKISPYAASSSHCAASSSHVLPVPLKAAAVSKPKFSPSLTSSSSDFDLPEMPLPPSLLSLPEPLSFSSPETEMIHLSFDLIRLINNVRSHAQLCVLTVDDTLVQLAVADAQYMASNNKLTHNHGTITPIDRVIGSGFCTHRYSTEIIAVTKDRNLQTVVEKWMNSTTSSHILNGNYQLTGPGLALAKDGTIYIAQVLTRKAPLYV